MHLNLRVPAGDGSFPRRAMTDGLAEGVSNKVAWLRARFTGKPLVVSEIGAGAVPGWEDTLHGFWSAGFQAGASARGGGYHR